MAVQTVYATFGSKAGVLQALPDTIDQEAGLYEIVERWKLMRRDRNSRSSRVLGASFLSDAATLPTASVQAP